ncbi:MAG TPA: hypothetical protein VD962_09280 [Rubricoccaceae bacterium]|nr:hypothetical protein [Rubricoccaceae bacterium]
MGASSLIGLIGATLVLTAGCRIERAPSASNGPTAVTRAPQETAAAAPRPAPEDSTAATVRAMVAGDRACYLTLESDLGQLREAMADFALCERRDLLGRRVRLRVEPAQVQAASCAGNPECTDTETVPLVRGAEVLR